MVRKLLLGATPLVLFGGFLAAPVQSQETRDERLRWKSRPTRMPVVFPYWIVPNSRGFS